MVDIDRWAKKVQYLTVDSDFVHGSNNAFSVYFGQESNVFIQEMRDVIGIKLVDFFITSIDGTVVKYVDVICPDIPVAAQILDERKGQLFARITNERDYKEDTDKQGKIFTQKTNFFNPLSIKQLAFQIYESHVDGSYVTLDPASQFHMILEITTLDHLNPPPDTNYRVVNAIDRLVTKIDELIAKIPKEVPEKKKKISSVYLFGFIAALAAMWFWFFNSSGPTVSQAVAPVMVPRL